MYTLLHNSPATTATVPPTLLVLPLAATSVAVLLLALYTYAQHNTLPAAPGNNLWGSSQHSIVVQVHPLP